MECHSGDSYKAEISTGTSARLIGCQLTYDTAFADKTDEAPALVGYIGNRGGGIYPLGVNGCQSMSIAPVSVLLSVGSAIGA